MKDHAIKSIIKRSKGSLSEENKVNLKEKGYCIIYKTKKEWMDIGIDLDLISDVIDNLIKIEDWRGGWDNIKHLMIQGQHPEKGAQRLNNLLRKHECFKKLFTINELLEASWLVIQSEIALSQIILRMPFPGEGDQPWHVDWSPRKKNNEKFKSVLGSLLLDDYSKDNGSTRLIPGTHNTLKTPANSGYYYQDHPEQVYLEAPKGSMLIYNSQLWHRGSKCINGKRRRHININYRSRNIWQQINFKKELPEKIKNSFSEDEKYLLKIRHIDKNRNEFLFRYRNNFLVKRITDFIWS